MKCNAGRIIKAQRKINKAQYKRRFMSKEEKEALDKRIMTDKDVQELLYYNKMRKLKVAEENY